MRNAPLMCFGLALAAVATMTSANTITVNDNGDVGPGNCNSVCTLRDAIAVATPDDDIQFAPGLNSPIALQSELSIGKKLKIAGPGAGVLTISGNNASRVLNITADVTIGDVTIADGAVTGGNGDSGSAGSGTGGNGSSGVPGEAAVGACVLVGSGANVVLDHVAIRHCVATGGIGGNGGAGAPGSLPGPGGPGSAGGSGGNGGSGGAAKGAAIFTQGTLSLIDSSVVDAQAIGGNGGGGGIGSQLGIPPGMGGAGGSGGEAIGGAVYADTGSSLRIFNTTVANSSGTGGIGGNGAAGGAIPGFGGIGGYATGGLLGVGGNVMPADLEFSTLANGFVTGGAAGGPSGPGAGAPSGNAINAASTLNVLSSIVVGAQGGVDLCYSPVTPNAITPVPGSANLSETTNNTINPSACNDFSLHGTLADTLKPIDASATPVFMPIWKSSVIDAAMNCNDLTGHGLSADQHDTPRPQGSACDLGAIEADYIFVDGFGE